MEYKFEENKPFFLKGSNNIGILLIHGWSSPPDELFPLAKYLNSLGYTVSAPLLTGHGTRPEDLLGVKWRDWLDDSQRALEELKQEVSVIFVGGISMGANLAMLISEDESVAGIISMGAPIRFHVQPIAKVGLYILGLCKTYRKKYYPPWVRKKMANRKVYSYYPVESAKEVVRLAQYTEKFLPRVQKPILVMQSTTDFLVAKKSPKIIFDRIKSEKKEIYWMPEAYHVFVEEKVVWEKIREFIEKI